MTNLAKDSPWKKIGEMPLAYLLTSKPLLFYFESVGQVSYGTVALVYDNYNPIPRVQVSGVVDRYGAPSLYMVAEPPVFVEETPF